MKRVLIFLFLAVVIDQGLGLALGKIQSKTFTGDRGGLMNYALTKDAQVLVLGSSRAQFHIQPRVLTAKLGLTAYNAGLKGQDFLYSVMFHDLWTRRHPAPKILVLTVDIESLIPRETEIATAQLIAPYLDESPLVREILYSGSPWKRLQFLSRSYRFNGNVLSLAKHAFHKPPADYDGFSISPGALDPVTDTGVWNALDQDRTAAEMVKVPFSAQKVGYLRALAEQTAREGTRFFLLHTPLFRQDEAAHKAWVDELQATIATMPGVKFIDLCVTTHPEVWKRPELYRNLNHVNEKGAEVLTEMLADEIQKSAR